MKRAWPIATALTFAACAGSIHEMPRGSRAGDRVAPKNNITRDAYVGSSRCRECHASEFDSFARSPMHNMTRDAATAEVRAPFDGTTFHFKNDTATFVSNEGTRFIRIESGGVTTTYRVTKVIGGRYREDFVGVQVDHESPSDEVVLPVSYLIFARKFRYKGYSVMTPERSLLRAGAVWKETCIFCHNTAPYLSTIFGALEERRTTPYQGEVVDTRLPIEMRRAFSITDDARAAREVEKEITFLGGEAQSGENAQTAIFKAIRATRDRFDQHDLVELGIGCETCHGGSRLHAEDPKVHPSIEPFADFLRIDLPKKKRPGSNERALATNHACARCHQVLFSRYPWTWEGGTRDRASGGSHISSGEGRDFLLGACSGAMSCTACHDPHASDERAKLAEFETSASNQVCTTCHEKFATSDAVKMHTHHDAAGAGGVCVNCHMPKKNMSLDGTLSRYHRIGSPTDAERVLLDRPLECAICHADKSVASLVTTMEMWWKKSYERGALTKLYGDLDANVLRATLDRGKPHEKAVAMDLLGRAKSRDAAAAIASELTGSYPIVREYARSALERIVGEQAPFELQQDDDAIVTAARAWLSAKRISFVPIVPAQTRAPDHEEAHDTD